MPASGIAYGRGRRVRLADARVINPREWYNVRYVYIAYTVHFGPERLLGMHPQAVPGQGPPCA